MTDTTNFSDTEPLCVHCEQTLDSHVPIEREGQFEQVYFICPLGLKIKGIKRDPKYVPINTSDGYVISNPNSGKPLAFRVINPNALYLLNTYTAGVVSIPKPIIVRP